MKKMLFLLVIPVVVVVLFAFRMINKKTIPVWVNKPLVVMIDAGHGGKQPGVTTPEVSEKTLTLAISEKVKKYAEEAGMNVLMTRTEDVDLGVMDRVKLATNARPDILVSIHVSNELGGSSKNGIECYAGANNPEALSAQSVAAAKQVMQSLSSIKGIGVNAQLQSRKESIAVLKLVPCPAILLECGYLSNPTDYQFITNEEKQNELARQIVSGLLKYAEKRSAPIPQGGSENDLQKEPVPLEARIMNLHQFSPEGMVILDGKEISQSLLPGINPGKIIHHVYYEAGNEMAIKKYGERATSGLLRLETKGGKGDYAFIGETEKKRWMNEAYAHRRMNTAERFDHIVYTQVNGKEAEVLVIACGSRSPQLPQTLRYMAGSWNGRLKEPIKYIVDGKEVDEKSFSETIYQLPADGYEVVNPWGKNTGDVKQELRVEIKKMAGALHSFPGVLDNIIPKSRPASGWGC